MLIYWFVVLTLVYVVTSNKFPKPSICKFPFRYKGKSYNECTNKDSTIYWCSTNAIYNGTYSHCESRTKSDEGITDAHFLQLLEKAKIHEKRLKNLSKNVGDGCSNCLLSLNIISKSIVEMSTAILDENKQVKGLLQQHSELVKKIDDIKKYYQLRRCRQIDMGSEYLGTIFVAASGDTCQRWIDQTPNSHLMTEDDRFPENSVSLADNMCRNPDLSSQPWCYLTNITKRWGYCHIPKCYIDCKIDSKLNSTLPMCDAFQSSVCKSGSVFYDNYCYKWHSQHVHFTTAESICVAEGGHLVSIGTSAEGMFLNDQTKSLGYVAPLWIGLTDNDTETIFRWTDGSPFVYNKFYAGEPNNADYRGENCVEFNRFSSQLNAWNDINCFYSRPFICKARV